MSDVWTGEELASAVNAYIEMLNLHRAGKPFVKRHYYKDLTVKHNNRTEKSFEYRMQNISYVLSLMGREWLPGLKPAKNVGANVAEKIEEFLSRAEGVKASPVVAFEIQVREELRKKKHIKPVGTQSPTSSLTTVTQFKRDPSVKAWVLKEAKGNCECCKKSAPFLGTDGVPFLEVHHVRKLADHGSDTVSNAVALCPNRHRELHCGQQAKLVVEKLYTQVVRLKRE